MDRKGYGCQFDIRANGVQRSFVLVHVNTLGLEGTGKQGNKGRWVQYDMLIIMNDTSTLDDVLCLL